MIYRSGTVNSNTVNSKFHLIRSYYEIFFYHFPNISCLKCTVNSNFHLIQIKTLLTNDFELTVPNLYFILHALDLWRKMQCLRIMQSKFSRTIIFCNVISIPIACRDICFLSFVRFDDQSWSARILVFSNQFVLVPWWQILWMLWNSCSIRYRGWI